MIQWTCPAPLREYPLVTLGHGGGGRLTEDLVAHLFEPAFGLDANTALRNDAAVLAVPGSRIAVTTDAHVVQPLEFPGGTIGELAVYGTVNDLAMVGALPVALTAAFVLEEGLAMDVLARIAGRMGEAARGVGVKIASGDTKVVGTGQADGMYVVTTGVGLVPDGVDIRPERIAPGDSIVLSGPIGMHGIAVLSVREGLEFNGSVESDTAPLHRLVSDLVSAGIDVHAMRDLTRGGLSAAMCELAEATELGLMFDESQVEIPDSVAAACDLFGLDPLEVANEGRLIAFVSGDHSERAVEVMHRHDVGAGAAVIGEVVSEHAGRVVQRTRLGSRRVVQHPHGEQLPRIC